MRIIKIIEAPEGLNAFYEKDYSQEYEYMDVSYLAIVEEQTDDGVILSVKGILNSESGKNNVCDGLMFADAYPDFAYMDYPDEGNAKVLVDKTV